MENVITEISPSSLLDHQPNNNKMEINNQKDQNSSSISIPLGKDQEGTSKEEENEVDEEEPNTTSKMVNKRDGDSLTIRKGGGWKTMPYIIGNETFEKLASMSLIANMTVYLRSQYNMDGLSSVSLVNIWSGTCNIAPLLGAFVSDAYLGRFWTLISASITYFLGMGIITLTAAIPHLRPPSCNDKISPCQEPKKWQYGVLFTGLGLLAIGAGGIRPCNIAFGVDQFDTTTEKGRKNVESFYNWYYWSFTLALLIALTLVVYIQSNISWAWGLAIPTAFIFLSIVVFILGCRVYIYMKPKGSVFSGITKVIIASFRKRKLKINPGSGYTLYNTEDSSTGLQLTDRFTFLTKAAVITERDQFDDRGLPMNEWRLCSVQQVEQLKCILSVLPVWASGITCFIAMDQQTTQGILQAIQMDRRLTNNFRVPPGSMGVVSMFALSVWIPIYEHIVLPLSRKWSKDGEGITLRHRLGLGILMSILCMLTGGIVERERRALALKNGMFIAPMSFAWLLPQYILSGMTEAFMGIGVLEFLGKQFPPSMRTLATSLFFFSLATANYLSSILINLIHKITEPSSKDGNPGWLGGHDLNKNKLDYYYFFLAGICVVNLFYFLIFACRYVHSNKVAERRATDMEMN